LNNIFKTVVPVISYYYLENQTYNFDYQSNAWWYYVDAKSVTITEVLDFLGLEFKFSEAQDFINSSIGIQRVATDLNIHFNPFYIWPVTLTKCTFEEPRLNFTLGVR
jgi:hypothetical protein